MNSPDLIEALQALAVDKGISIDTLFGALADAFESAYKRLPNSQEYAWVIIDPDTGEILDDEADDNPTAAEGRSDEDHGDQHDGTEE